jgi:hypothetical protein
MARIFVERVLCGATSYPATYNKWEAAFSGVVRIGWVRPGDDWYVASDKQKIFFLLGGSVANLALGVLINEIVTRYPSVGPATSDSIPMLGFFTVVSALFNLIPFRLGRLESDGLQIYEIYKGGRHWR